MITILNNLVLQRCYEVQSCREVVREGCVETFWRPVHQVGQNGCAGRGDGAARR